MSALKFEASARRTALAIALLLVVAWVVAPLPARAQVPTLDTKLWVANATVRAVASFGDTIYAAGDFTEVGKATGGAAVFEPTNGSILNPFPSVLGTVHAVISDGAGGCYIGGEFTHVGGLPRSNLAQIAADGTVTSWDPNAINQVEALYLSPSGTVYVGGFFSQVGGQPRSRIAEVNPDGTVTAFAPVMNGAVRAITMYNGAVIAGGDFTLVGVTPRNRLAMLTTGGGLFTWNPNSLGPVHVMRVVTRFVPGTGNVTSLLVGGAFSNVGSFGRNNAAMLDFITGLATNWNPNVSGPVYAFEVTTNGYYIGGNFTAIGGNPRPNVALVDDQVGALSGAWAPAVNGEVRAILNRGSSVVIGGRFSSAGGQARRALAAFDNANPNSATAWNPRPSHDVLALLDGGSRIVAGGVFTAANMVTRNRLASFLRSSGAPTSWNPNADNVVTALALDVVGGGVRSVVVGGYFGNVGGAVRTRLASLEPQFGGATSWNPTVTGAGQSVRTFCLTGGTLYVGGHFTALNGQSRVGAGAYTLSSGALTSWNPNLGANGMALALTASATKMYIGGAFASAGGQPRTNLARVDRNLGAVDLWAASADDYVFDVQLGFGRVYAGGFFQNANGQPRRGAAAFDTTNGILDSWNADVDGSVYTIAITEDRVVLGGSFDLSHGFARPSVVRIDSFLGLPDGLDFGTSGSVMALDILGTRFVVGGSFTGAQGLARPNLAVFDEVVPGTCAPGPLVSPAGVWPKDLAPGDFDGDGITDLLVFNKPPDNFWFLSALRGLGTAGVGNGAFAPYNSYVLGGSEMQAVAADFDADGLDDVAVAMRDNALGHQTGSVFVLRNLGGGNFENNPPIEFELLGHADGLAVGDVTNDGILDIAVCLRDSAGISDRGGIQLVRGTGSNGIWDGGFVTAWKAPTSWASRARRVVLQDFNLDGSLDVAYSGAVPGQHRILRLAPGGTPIAIEGINASPDVFESGVGITIGDLNGDGRADLVNAGQRIARIYMRSANDEASLGPVWFTNTGGSTLPLASTPREIALHDYDFDGKLDLVCAMDSTSRIEVHLGIGDGTFDVAAWNVAYPTNAYGLVIADVVTNGSADFVVSQPPCGTVITVEQTQTSPLVLDLDLTAPNGGEVWAQLPFAEGTSAVAPSLSGIEELETVPVGAATLAAATAPSLALASDPELPKGTSTQFVTWTKGNGIATVDVEVSRDGGDSWQPIGRNQPGTMLRWIATPPASGAARVRVRDSNVLSRVDASDELFQIQATTVGVDPSMGLPRVAAIRMLGANPVRAGGAIEFRVDVPRAADVRVDVYDVAGRHVRTLARGRLDAGTHTLPWNVADGSSGATRPAGPRSGVYFIRALIGDVKATSKFAVLQ